MYYIAQLIGFVGIVANAVIYQQNNRIKLLAAKLTSDILWMLHYGFIGAYSGMAVAVIGMIREGVFLADSKNKEPSEKWLIIFMIINVISAALTWKNIYSILPAAASILSVISFWNKRVAVTRVLSFPISISMLIYDISALSYSGIVNEILTLSSSAVSMIRYNNKS